MLTIDIKEANDFEKIRIYEGYKPLGNNNEYGTMTIIVNILKDIKFEGIFKPLVFDSYDIIIKGNNKTISNLIVYDAGQNNGLFSSVNSIIANNLTVSTTIIRGTKNSGCIVGFCKNDAVFNNIKILNSMIISKGYSGGLVGLAKNVSVNYSMVNSFITGINYVGGFAGICVNYKEINSQKLPTLLVMGNNHDNSVGYSRTKIIKDEDDKQFKLRYF